MAYRIELTFVGEAPEDELARAKVMASKSVEEAIADLSRALEAAGMAHSVTARTIKSTPARANSGRKRRLAAVEAAE